ncbi:hypothetical protein R1sor_014101 [Riccia sorocarpa]|uniref:Uncharacterized protein n=1 Tax=Riccia sorocarpa TaxID=122646 RepID=A0ABD3HBF9_9MARC
MTRPLRPKYPSDSQNYHELPKPGHAHTDSDGDIDEDGQSNDGESQGSDEDMTIDHGAVAADSEEEDLEISCCFSQVQSNVETTLTLYPDATYAFWSKGKIIEFIHKFYVYALRRIVV